jgi:hypothetical protein
LKRDGGNRSREASPDYGRRPRLDGDDARNRLNRGRGGQGDHDTNRVLDREGLESMRPDIKPWDINPEYVPKGGNYYEVREGGNGTFVNNNYISSRHVARRSRGRFWRRRQRRWRVWQSQLARRVRFFIIIFNKEPPSSIWPAAQA